MKEDLKLKEAIFEAVKEGFKNSNGDWSKLSWLWQNQPRIYKKSVYHNV